MSGVEVIAAQGVVLGYLIRASTSPDATMFITDEAATLQTGFVVYRSGGEVVPHVHLPVQRTVIGTAEFILIRSGRCAVDIYSDQRELVATRELSAGDAILSLTGGHGFRMLEDTVLFELKQGPFLPGRDKERFERPTEPLAT